MQHMTLKKNHSRRNNLGDGQHDFYQETVIRENMGALLKGYNINIIRIKINIL